MCSLYCKYISTRTYYVSDDCLQSWSESTEKKKTLKQDVSTATEAALYQIKRNILFCAAKKGVYYTLNIENFYMEIFLIVSEIDIIRSTTSIGGLVL